MIYDMSPYSTHRLSREGYPLFLIHMGNWLLAWCLFAIVFGRYFVTICVQNENMENPTVQWTKEIFKTIEIFCMNHDVYLDLDSKVIFYFQETTLKLSCKMNWVLVTMINRTLV